MEKIEFYDEKGQVKDNLYSDVAENIAKKMVYSFSAGKRDKVNGVSRSQLRKLFDEFKRLQKILKEKDNWDELYPQVKLIKSKVAYAIARAKKNSRGVDKQYDELNKFLVSGINSIKTKKDFFVFCTLFEAVYGFYYQLGGVELK